MAKTKELDSPVTTGGPFKKGAKVRLAESIPGVPRGTHGRVKLVNGLTWKRYWVFFENGVNRGSIDGSALVETNNWDRYLIDSVNAAAEAEAAEAEAAEAASAAPAVESGAEGGDDKPKVPAHLLERAAAAKAKKAAEAGD